jgi:hypothetical protein
MGNNPNFDIDAGLRDIVGAFADPIIVMPGGWGEDIPDWLKDEITLERLIENMKSLKGEAMTATDAEACAYLMTASLTAPISESWVRIYLYVSGVCMKRHNKELIMPQDINVETLDVSDTRELASLKAWIYKTRVEARKNKNQDKGAKQREFKESKPQISLF